MNPVQIHENFKTVMSLLSEGKLKSALAKCELLVNELQEGSYTDRFNELSQNYQFLLDYFIRGVEDSQRKQVYNRIVAQLFELNCELREELMYRVSTGFEYLQKRYFPHRLHFADTENLIDSLNYYHQRKNDSPNENTHRNYEALLNDVFVIFWLSTSYKPDVLRLYNTVISDNYEGRLEKNLTVSALTLNLWRMFDEEKLKLLLDCCSHSDVEVKQRALVGLCFVLARYNRFIPYFPVIRNRLVLLADDEQTLTNFRNIIVQIISTVETDKITRKLRDEILPEIMKVSPLLKDKLDTENLLSPEEWEEANPEWQEMLEKSGVQDKIKEFTDLQQEGADVYMGTFAMLKSFPFFNEISSWFLPFDASHSAVSMLFDKAEKNLLTAFVSNNTLCNSDKYSFCLSIMQMPESQRAGLQQSFRMESEQLAEMAKDEAILTPGNYAKNISKQYVQDLFRFFKLHPNCKDFPDMFASALFMHKSYLFDILTSGNDLKSDVAEFYFSKSQYNEAIELFSELISDGEPSAALFQKIGYCYQQLSDIDKALEAYKKSDIIQPDSLWTTKKIALCYKLKGDYANALDYYKHAAFLQPDKQNIKLQIANCHLELQQYKQALELYTELEKSDDNNIRVLRAIIWCAFLSGNMAQAQYYSQRVVEDMAHSTDYLHAAYIEWNRNNIQGTIALFKRAYLAQSSDIESFLAVVTTDLGRLRLSGINLTDSHLVFDALRTIC